MAGGWGSEAYVLAIRARISHSLSMARSSNLGTLNLFFRSVLPQPATGHGPGPWENILSTQESHILW